MAKMAATPSIRPAPRQAPAKSAEPPRWLTSMLKFVLRTPLHVIFSKGLMLIEFHGRKTGKLYRTPVSYMREGDTVTSFTDSPWRRNLVGGAPVTLYLKGKAVRGFAEVIDDRKAITEALMRYLPQARTDAGYYGVSFDANGQPIREQVEKGSRGYVMLKINLSVPI